MMKGLSSMLNQVYEDKYGTRWMVVDFFGANGLILESISSKKVTLRVRTSALKAKYKRLG